MLSDIQKERIITLYKDNGICFISKQEGIAKSTIRFFLKKSGLIRSSSDGMKLFYSKNESKSKGIKRGPHSNEWRSNISKSRIGKGVGTTVKPSGYIEFTMGT